MTPEDHGQAARRFVAVSATEIPLSRPTHVCGPCGIPLRRLELTENLMPHPPADNCGGTWEWMDER